MGLPAPYVLQDIAHVAQLKTKRAHTLALLLSAALFFCGVCTYLLAASATSGTL